MHLGASDGVIKAACAEPRTLLQHPPTSIGFRVCSRSLVVFFTQPLKEVLEAALSHKFDVLRDEKLDKFSPVGVVLRIVLGFGNERRVLMHVLCIYQSNSIEAKN